MNLRTIDYKEAWRISFDKAERDDVAKALELPKYVKECCSYIRRYPEGFITNRR